jgi:hypothetical protein
MDLYEFLSKNGYQFLGKEGSPTLGIKTKKNTNLGLILKPENSKIYSEIHISYARDPQQIGEALKLRDLLDSKNIVYVEVGGREQAAEYLRQEATNLTSLATKLEGL